MKQEHCGTLYIVATPIGNLKDITQRAIEVLKSVDLIACEDTRQTKKLTTHYQIITPLTSFYQYNRLKKIDFLIKKLKEGKNVALVSDAGTPGISDPGFYIIQKALSNDIPITCIPGPVALITALVLSGKPTDKFFFEGFLPAKKGKRRRRLEWLYRIDTTIIIYESPHRIPKTLQDILDTFGDREIVIARELTKKFEEVKREKISYLLKHFTQVKPRGEFIVII